jgi:hypothetical protein
MLFKQLGKNGGDFEEIGGKAYHLEWYRRMLEEAGFVVPSGWVIDSRVFDRFMEIWPDSVPWIENFAYNALQDCGNIMPLWAIALMNCNDLILEEMVDGQAYAIRSSAVSEAGGNGIYHTGFFVRTGDYDLDMQRLWDAEQKVYASEVSEEAKAWREKMEKPIGMAILIQPVSCVKLPGQSWQTPALSGVAYTSYLGQPFVRVVKGLGTKAVAGQGLVHAAPPSDNFYFARDLWDQDMVDAIDLTSGEVIEVRGHYEGQIGEISFDDYRAIFEKLAALQKHGNFYLEWVLTPQGIEVVQCAPYVDTLPGSKTVNTADYFLLTESRDVFRCGEVECAGVICVREWGREAAETLLELNQSMRNYLLIVPEVALSELGKITALFDNGGAVLQFQHFSNAAAVVESQRPAVSIEKKRELMDRLDKIPGMYGQLFMGQPEHNATYGRGGACHFQGLCGDADILFVGGVCDVSSLLTIPAGDPEYRDIVTVDENRKAVVFIGDEDRTGYVYLQKPKTVAV